MAKQKKPNKYEEKVKIDIPDSWGFDDTLKAVALGSQDATLKATPSPRPRKKV